MHKRMSAGLVWMALLACGAAARAQGGTPEFPQDPNAWINSPPFSLRAVEGKATVLYFFEET